MPLLELPGVTLGAQNTAIIVPITASDIEAVRTQAQLAAASSADLVEWRVDAFTEALAPGTAPEEKLLAPIAQMIHKTSGLPVLATVRTKPQGGAFTGSPTDYEQLVGLLATLAGIVAVDVEYHHPAARGAIELAHRANTAVIASHHDFASTPRINDMVAHLEAMEQTGAQVCKLAVMPQSAADTARLLLATAQRALTASTPLITIAMGELGRASRINGRTFGSCASFASVDEQGSAPGQLPVDELARVLEIIEHRPRVTGHHTVVTEQ